MADPHPDDLVLADDMVGVGVLLEGMTDPPVEWPAELGPVLARLRAAGLRALGSATPAYKLPPGDHPFRVTDLEGSPVEAGQVTVETIGEPDHMVTITPTGWDETDGEYPHHDSEGNQVPWVAITYRWPGDPYPGGAPDPYWTWELVDPAGPVVLDGTSTDDPAPFLQRLVDLLQPGVLTGAWRCPRCRLVAPDHVANCTWREQ